jgi:hypothetical protein
VKVHTEHFTGNKINALNRMCLAKSRLFLGPSNKDSRKMKARAVKRTEEEMDGVYAIARRFVWDQYLPVGQALDPILERLGRLGHLPFVGEIPKMKVQFCDYVGYALQKYVRD